MRTKRLQAIEASIALPSGAAACVSASIGWAQYPSDGLDVDALLKVAGKRVFERMKARAAG